MGEGFLVKGAALEKVAANDAVELRAVHAMVPDALGIDEEDGALLTEAQAVGLGAIHRAARAGEPELAQARLQMVPDVIAGARRATLRAAAEKDMSANPSDAQAARLTLQGEKGRDFRFALQDGKRILGGDMKIKKTLLRATRSAAAEEAAFRPPQAFGAAKRFCSPVGGRGGTPFVERDARDARGVG